MFDLQIPLLLQRIFLHQNHSSKKKTYKLCVPEKKKLPLKLISFLCRARLRKGFIAPALFLSPGCVCNPLVSTPLIFFQNIKGLEEQLIDKSVRREFVTVVTSS